MKTLHGLVRAVVTATLLTAGLAGTTGVAHAATDHWGAVAFSPRSGHTGVSWDYPTAAAAAAKARDECGRSDCQAVVEVANGCAALAQAQNRAVGYAYAARCAPPRAAPSPPHSDAVRG